MRRKSLILLLLSLGLLAGFFILPANWFWAEKLRSYAGDFQRQSKHLSLEERKKSRYESAYTISRNIANALKKQVQVQNVLLLVPSSDYFRNYGIQYPVPEPAVFYYYTGLKTIWSTSPDAVKANWIAGVTGGKIHIKAVRSEKELRDSIRSFNLFPPHL